MHMHSWPHTHAHAHTPPSPACPRRQQLGVAMAGNPALQHLINVHFFSPQLAQLLQPRPAMLHFVFSRQAIVVMVTHSMARGEFVAQVRGASGGMAGRPSCCWHALLRLAGVLTMLVPCCRLQCMSTLCIASMARLPAC